MKIEAFLEELLGLLKKACKAFNYYKFSDSE